VLSSNFRCKENNGTIGGVLHPGLVTSDYGVHEVGVTVCEFSMFIITSRRSETDEQ
jgi:hypothetical protein